MAEPSAACDKDRGSGSKRKRASREGKRASRGGEITQERSRRFHEAPLVFMVFQRLLFEGGVSQGQLPELLKDTGLSVKDFRDGFLRTYRQHGAGDQLASFMSSVFHPVENLKVGSGVTLALMDGDPFSDEIPSGDPGIASDFKRRIALMDNLESASKTLSPCYSVEQAEQQPQVEQVEQQHAEQRVGFGIFESGGDRDVGDPSAASSTSEVAYDEAAFFAIQVQTCRELAVATTTSPLRTALIPFFRCWHPFFHASSRMSTAVFQWLQEILASGHVPHVEAKAAASGSATQQATPWLSEDQSLDGCLRATRANYDFIDSWGLVGSFEYKDLVGSFVQSRKTLITAMGHRYGGRWIIRAEPKDVDYSHGISSFIANAHGPGTSDRDMPDKGDLRWVCFARNADDGVRVCGVCQSTIRHFGVHGTSAFALDGAFDSGLRGGHQGELKGVYFMPLARAHLACGYSVYAHLFRDGWFWSVLLLLGVCKTCTKTKGKGSTQQCVLPCATGEVCKAAYIDGVWMKGVHYTAFHKPKKWDSSGSYSECSFINRSPWPWRFADVD